MRLNEKRADQVSRTGAGGLRRRRMLAGLGGLGGAALAACGPMSEGGPSGTSPTQGPVTIKLSMWDYRPDIVRDNVDRFERENPGIKVEGPETGECCDIYRNRMNTAFLAGERLDAMYMRDEDAAEWAEAKWVLALDRMPGAKELTRDEYPFVTEQTNYKGKKYGTIYYVGPQIALYNKEHVRQAGFTRPPATFDELRTQANQIKRQKVNGVEFPLWGAPGGATLENLYLASGKRMFDDDLQATFGKDVLFKDMVDKLFQAYTGDKVFGVDATVQAPFDNGKSSYTWTSFYDLKRLNGQATGAVAGGQAGGAAAGQLMNYVNPGFVAGKTGTQAICRQYAVAAASKHPDQAYKLIYFLGGKDGAGTYSVAKRWWIEQGLNFGYKSMADDPEIKKFVEGWGDLETYNKVMVSASPRPGVKAPWSALWRTESNTVFADVFAGKMTSKDGIERSVQIWNQMKADFERNNPGRK
jgi:ABC-type glycerol-3-phosphate transport system substrate-binding protein